jgi:hypothetical protein
MRRYLGQITTQPLPIRANQGKTTPVLGAHRELSKSFRVSTTDAAADSSSGVAPPKVGWCSMHFADRRASLGSLSLPNGCCKGRGALHEGSGETGYGDVPLGPALANCDHLYIILCVQLEELQYVLIPSLEWVLPQMRGKYRPQTNGQSPRGFRSPGAIGEWVTVALS